MNQAEQENHCVICERKKDDGYKLTHVFLCRECEQEMIHTDPNDPKYTYFLKKLRVLKQATQYS
ncbi:CsfB [Pontibacillus halophilus JSM 076056 = DSM 19796]|uniref:CsfB n=1 Tax=Pontibacillus halophilus JSM 076056 = DSM 19796 TaxID=1385510 RepID=A0A0A5I2N1_9BACI|nr:sigma factor G inhibitor Gin [Pontibacillus halophilus]KGX90107.1 CsfB [Pontibacillus halophilus JSM 076056 = DSM 19796]